MTEEEAVDYLWKGKSLYLRQEGGGVVLDDRKAPVPNPDFGKCFLYATLNCDADMHVWNGRHPPEGNTVVRTAKAGTTVLVTMVSRFGDVGIRDDRLAPPSDGYYCRVPPGALFNWRMDPG